MIDLLSEEHVEKIIKERKQRYKFGQSCFYILTPDNDIFWFSDTKDLALTNPTDLRKAIRQPDILKKYGLVYKERKTAYPDLFVFYDREFNQTEVFYELCINNPQCLFFSTKLREKELLEQELQNRGLV